MLGIHHEVDDAGLVVDEEDLLQVLPPSVDLNTPRSGFGLKTWPIDEA